MKINKLGNTPFSFPEEMNELTARQLQVIISFTFNKTDIKESKIEILKAFFYRNWGILWLFLKNEKLIPLIDFLTFGLFTFNQYVLGEGSLIDMIRSASSFLLESDSHFTKQLFPIIQVREKRFSIWRQKLFGPEDELKSITFKEFISLDFFYQLYAKNQEEKHLNKLCAIMYRPKNEAFKDDDSINKRAALFERVPFITKLCIFQFYDGCRKEIVENNEDLFPKKKETDTPKEITTDSIIEQYEMWKAVPAEFSDKPNDVSEQENVLLHQVISFLNHKAKRNEEIKQQLEKK